MINVGWEVIQEGDFFHVVDSEGVYMLPGITMDGVISEKPYWSGFGGSPGEFLDHEFIYHPFPPDINITNLPGNKYKTYRKNVRKFLKDNEPLELLEIGNFRYIEHIMEEWANSKGEPEIHDGDAMIRILTNDPLLLYIYSGNRCLGFIVYDINYKYVNFRYCFVNPNYWGLSEYARLLFHQFVGSRFCTLLINDGGSLGSEQLYRFKKRLNPYQINQINTTLK
jgi:hypothetical protein